MATYTELRNLFANDEMKNKLDVAVVIAANDLLAGTPTAAEQSWAAMVFDNPRTEGEKAYRAVLATNKNADTATILAASDTAIQAQVDAVVPSLVIAYGV